jgi:hypothetical protein
MRCLKIVGLTIGLSFVSAAIIGFFIRMPAPFDKYRSGLGGLLNSPVAVVVHGVLLGGLLLSIALAFLAFSIMNAARSDRASACASGPPPISGHSSR